MKYLSPILIGLVIFASAIIAQDINDFEFGSTVVELNALINNGIVIECEAPYPSGSSPPYDIKITYKSGGDGLTVAEVVGICVGSIASWTNMTTWKSRWLYIRIGDQRWRISTSDCRKAVAITNPGQRGLYIISHLEQL